MKPKLNRNHRNYIDEIFSICQKNKVPKEIKKSNPKPSFKKQKHSDSTHSHGPTEAEGKRRAGQLRC